jgi:hypothetical protein
MSRHQSNPKLHMPPPSRGPSSAIISVNNVEPLTRAHLRKHDARERAMLARRLPDRDSNLVPIF